MLISLTTMFHSGSAKVREDDLVTEGLCLSISPHVGVCWKKVLRKLNIDEMAIRNLEEDHKNSGVVEKCYQGLLAWKESVGPQEATTKKLRDALRPYPKALKAMQSYKEDTSNSSDC